MDGSLFCVRVEVDMPDVHATAILPERTGS